MSALTHMSTQDTQRSLPDDSRLFLTIPLLFVTSTQRARYEHATTVLLCSVKLRAVCEALAW